MSLLFFLFQFVPAPSLLLFRVKSKGVTIEVNIGVDNRAVRLRKVECRTADKRNTCVRIAADNIALAIKRVVSIVGGRLLSKLETHAVIYNADAVAMLVTAEDRVNAQLLHG